MSTIDITVTALEGGALVLRDGAAHVLHEGAEVTYSLLEDVPDDGGTVGLNIWASLHGVWHPLGIGASEGQESLVRVSNPGATVIVREHNDSGPIFLKDTACDHILAPGGELTLRMKPGRVLTLEVLGLYGG